MGDFYSDFREVAMAAAATEYPITAKGADTPGAFIVPKGAQYITALKIHVSGIVTDVVTGNTTSIRLVGLPGTVNLAGPLLSTAGAAATAGGFQYSKGEVYQTKIPVGGVAQFDARACFNGDDPGTLHMSLTVEYDGVPGRVVTADVREIAIGAAANTLLALTTLTDTATTPGNIKTNGRPIVEIHFGAALDPTGDAANGLVWMPAIEIDGTGLVTNNKPLTMVGPSGPTQPDTDVHGNGNCVTPLEIVIPGAGIRTQNGEVRVRAQNIESINPGQAICCLCFG